VAKTRARQDHRRQTGIGKVDRHSGRNEHRFARPDFHRGGDAGAQIQSG